VRRYPEVIRSLLQLRTIRIIVRDDLPMEREPMRRRCTPALLLLLPALVHAGPDPAPAPDAAAEAATADNVRLDRVEVRERALPDPPYPGVAPSLEGAKVAVGKKTTVVDLSQQPQLASDNLRAVLARTPGLLISEQQVPSFVNVNYRGLGDPHESEFVLFLRDDVPLMADWLGYSTLYAPPPPDRIERVEFIRGGASLLYGPQPGPTVNFVTRRADPAAPRTLRSSQVFGSDRTYYTYNEARGGDGRFGWQVGADFRRSDGQRNNGGYRAGDFTASLAWQPDEASWWALDAYATDSDYGEAGRQSLAQFTADPGISTTPFNRIFLDRHGVALTHERALGDATALVGKAWYAYLDRLSRRTTNIAPGTAPPAFTTLDRQRFTTGGLDLRVQHEWGDNHSFTGGGVLYAVDTPREQSRSSDLGTNASRGETLRFSQERDGRYAALFAENVFRFGPWSVVPGARVDFVDMAVTEPLKLSTLRRPALDVDFERTAPLFGLGVQRDLGAHQAYANVSRGYRPMRWDDIGNPTAELAASNDPELGYALNAEFGLRGAPTTGLYYDVSVFHIDLSDRIEQRIVPGTVDIERINTGDARHRGLEAAVEYDVFAVLRPDSGEALTVFANASLLDAEITASANPALVGNTPLYAPDHVVRAGVIWRAADGGKVSLAGTWVDRQFWQDSNLGSGSGASLLPAEIPAHHVLDLAVEWPLGKTASVVGGINNLTDETYYSRIRSDGIDPAPQRTGYLGVRLTL
jgi:Fe(3+) dicitrate transport protein